MSGAGDGVAPVIITSRDGSITVTGGGAVDLSVGGGAGRFVIPPTNTTNAAVTAAILAGHKILQLGAATYGLEAPLFTGLTAAQLSGVDIQGEGQSTVLVPTYVSAAGLASTHTNANVLVQGTVDAAAYNSILTRHAIIGDRTIAVAASLAGQVGNWVRLNGHNDPATAMVPLQAGTNITATEIVRIVSTTGGGLIAQLDGILMQEHTITNGGTGVAQSVQLVQPVIGFRMADMTILGTGHQIAVGILLDYCVEPILENLWFEGFSLSDRYARLGTRMVAFSDSTHRGGSNGWLNLESVCGGSDVRTISTGRGDRSHPLGTIAGSINMLWNTTQIDCTEFDLRHACRGVQTAAVMQVDLQGSVDDMFIAELLARPRTGSEIPWCGIGLDTGRGPLADAGFSVGMRIDMRLTNCRSNGPIGVNSPFTAFFHDTLEYVARIMVANEGESPYAVVDGLNYVLQGISHEDAGGVLDATIQGAEFGFYVQSSTQGLRVATMSIYGNPGIGTTAAVGVYFDKLASFNGITFGRLFSETASSYANASPNDVVYIESYKSNQFEYRDCQTFVNTTGATLQTGDLFQPDPAGINDQFGPCPTLAAGAGVTLGVCATGGGQATNGLAFDGSILPSPLAFVNVTAAAVVPGDLLDFGAGTRAKTNNAVAVHLAIGRATSFKGAGAVGVVRVGSAL